MKNSEFFDILSSNYDSMINFENSLQNKIERLKGFIEPNYYKALDLGCGTGVDSIALYKLGLKVDAIDQSSQMINQAIKNSEIFNSRINFTQSDITEFFVRTKYDLIISLGNTVANLSPEKFNKLLGKIKNKLNNNGKIVIQIVNYSALPITSEYLLNIFENDNISILRKYYFKENNVDFIIEINDKENKISKQIATRIYPHSIQGIRLLALQNNFKLNILGNLSKENYNKSLSKDLVAVFQNS
jgi:SAM-dependent methyltransferase